MSAENLSQRNSLEQTGRTSSIPRHPKSFFYLKSAFNAQNDGTFVTQAEGGTHAIKYTCSDCCLSWLEICYNVPNVKEKKRFRIKSCLWMKHLVGINVNYFVYTSKHVAAETVKHRCVTHFTMTWLSSTTVCAKCSLSERRDLIKRSWFRNGALSTPAQHLLHHVKYFVHTSANKLWNTVVWHTYGENEML